MFSAFSLFAGMLAVLLASGCATKIDLAEPSAKLAQQKNIAQQWAGKLKRNPPADAAALRTAEAKYREAASQNRGYLEAVANGIINNDNLESNPKYEALAEKASSSTKDFVDFAQQASGALEPASAGTVIIARVLVESGIAIWKAHRAETQAQRVAAADRLISQNSWEDWDKINTGGQ
ncbi:MAG TPA: hypothetical protein VIS96_12785 [Terrimicrobiaceae bacterium]